MPRTPWFRRTARSRDPLSTEGSLKYGGRFNSPGAPALYMAGSPDLAEAEFDAGRARLGLANFNAGLMSTISVAATRTLDLVDPDVRAALGIELADLVSEDPAMTREIGDSARLVGFDSVRFPSARDPKGVNLVFFPENGGPDALHVEAMDDHWPG